MSNVRAKFFKDGGFDRVEISIVGDPNTFITKVAPEHIARFPIEWEAYRSGEREIDYGGTPLTEVPGVDTQLATAYKLKGVHNAEMLADLSDAAARGLGMGALTNRRAAQLLLKANAFDKTPAEPAKRKPGRPPKARPEPESDAATIQ